MPVAYTQEGKTPNKCTEPENKGHRNANSIGTLTPAGVGKDEKLHLAGVSSSAAVVVHPCP